MNKTMISVGIALIICLGAAGGYKILSQTLERAAWENKRAELSALAFDLEHATNPNWTRFACRRAVELNNELHTQASVNAVAYMNGENVTPDTHLTPISLIQCS